MTEKRARVNIPNLILSLGLSLFLWAIVYVQTIPTETATLPIDFNWTGLDTNRFAVKRSPGSQIFVQVSGARQQVNQLRQLLPNLAATVNLQRAVAGKHAYGVTFNSPLLRDLATNPLLKAEFEIEVKERWSLPVKIQKEGQLSDPILQVRDSIAVPREVSIFAPGSVQKEIVEARAILDLSKLDPTRPEPIDASVRLYNARGVEIDPASKEITLTPASVEITPVLSATPVRRSVAVDVQLRGTPRAGYAYTGYVVEPNKVSLSGASEALGPLTQVSTQTVDLSGLIGSRSFDVALQLPRGVASASPARVRVKVSVRRIGAGGGE